MGIERQAMAQRAFASDVIAGGVPSVVPVRGGPLPLTCVLNSTNGGRLIEFSVDGGTNYFTPVYDSTTTPQIVVVAKASITHVRFTGVNGDTWMCR